MALLIVRIVNNRSRCEKPQEDCVQTTNDIYCRTPSVRFGYLTIPPSRTSISFFIHLIWTDQRQEMLCVCLVRWHRQRHDPWFLLTLFDLHLTHHHLHHHNQSFRIGSTIYANDPKWKEHIFLCKKSLKEFLFHQTISEMESDEFYLEILYAFRVAYLLLWMWPFPATFLSLRFYIWDNFVCSIRFRLLFDYFLRIIFFVILFYSSIVQYMSNMNRQQVIGFGKQDTQRNITNRLNFSFLLLLLLCLPDDLIHKDSERIHWAYCTPQASASTSEKKIRIISHCLNKQSKSVNVNLYNRYMLICVRIWNETDLNAGRRQSHPSCCVPQFRQTKFTFTTAHLLCSCKTTNYNTNCERKRIQTFSNKITIICASFEFNLIVLLTRWLSGWSCMQFKQIDGGTGYTGAQV